MTLNNDTKRNNQSNIPRGEISTKEVLELVTHKYYSCHSSAYSSRIDLLYGVCTRIDLAQRLDPDIQNWFCANFCANCALRAR
jgi:hypothetical protein